MKLPGVPKAKQGREVPEKWQWTEAEVWTQRMLATLERGITGGKWYSLMDNGHDNGCAPSCANDTKAKDAPAVVTINAGPMPTSPN
jgi:hypothetical protein